MPVTSISKVNYLALILMFSGRFRRPSTTSSFAFGSASITRTLSLKCYLINLIKMSNQVRMFLLMSDPIHVFRNQNSDQ